MRGASQPLRRSRAPMVSTATPLWERVFHHGSVLLVASTGLAYLWMKYGLPPSDDPFTVVNHPWQPSMLHLHVLFGPFLLVAIGMMLRDHVLGRLRQPLRRRGRRTGLGTVLLLLPMVASGYLLQTVTASGTRNLLVWTHVVSGCLYLGVYVAHLAASRLSARRQAARRELEAALKPRQTHLQAAPGAGATGAGPT